MRDSIRFVRKGKIVELRDVEPTALLLDYLREVEGAKGTKEGCAEGDCGACTVALGQLRNGKLVYEPVNACIQLVGQVDGCEVVAVEDLADLDGELHPVQSAMHDEHGSQCGFCTPGFVMSLFALYQRGEEKVDRDTVNDWIAGNLCRCTGYRPIVDAGLSVCANPPTDKFAANAEDTAGLLGFLADGDDIFVGDSDQFFAAPGTLDNLADLYENHPDATIVAGATDVGLWITKQFRDLPKIIYVGHAQGFDHIADTGYELLIGAGATYAAVEPHFRALDPDLGELLRRLGSKQVRASGTLGGNIANGSPIGDTPPALIALDAKLELRKGGQSRTIAMEDFFIDYGKQDRAQGEFVEEIRLPLSQAGERHAAYKISKRRDEDISSVAAGFRVTVQDGIISDARLAFGGMAATPRRAVAAEAALVGQAWHETAFEAAAVALAGDFTPLTDWRASAEYRAAAAANLLRRFFHEQEGQAPVRLAVA